jgi:hypothetical protein
VEGGHGYGGGWVGSMMSEAHESEGGAGRGGAWLKSSRDAEVINPFPFLPSTSHTLPTCIAER